MNEFINRIKALPALVKIIIVLLLAGGGWFTYKRFTKTAATAPQYQTETATKGTLIVSVSASGNVASANNASVTTQASGVVKRVLVENGQGVGVGTQIAELELDMEGKQRASQAFASYQSAKNSLENAKATYFTLQSSLFTNWKTYMDLAQSSNYQNADGSPKTDSRNLPQFMSTNDDWLAAEAKFKNQQLAIDQAQTALNSAWYTYQQASPVIYAPISGTVNGLSLQEGSVLTAQSNTSGTATSQKIASIVTNAAPTISINITEIDIPKVKIGNHATVTFSAFPDKTYTGTVISVDTVGSVSSGVITYPTVIKLDSDVPGIYPNMSVTANIITDTKTDALLVPVSAVQTQNGESSVRILQNGQVQPMAVVTGLSNDTETEIVSGIAEGDVVITGTVTKATTTTTTGQSPFGIRGFGGGGGGNARFGR